jgi:hypothetical protein
MLRTALTAAACAGYRAALLTLLGMYKQLQLAAGLCTNISAPQ